MKKSQTLFFLFFVVIKINAAFQPTTSEKYLILQSLTKSAKVISQSSFEEVILDYANGNPGQVFEFIAVSGKSDTYHIKNQNGLFLTNSVDVQWLTEYDSNPQGLYSEWILEGNSSENLRIKSATASYLATADENVGSFLLADKTATNLFGTFNLIRHSDVFQNNLIDGGFENAVLEGAPLGKWYNNASRTFGNENATTQNYRSRIIGTGYQVSAAKCFTARFYGDENSYTTLSYQLDGLEKGATYTFSFKSKQGNDNTATATVNSFIAVNPLSEKVNAISNIYTSTPPTTTATSQTRASASVSFVAPATTCFVVWAKNPATTKNFLYYLDDMKIEKTADAKSSVYCSMSSLSFDANNRQAELKISGVMLSDSIKIIAPEGILLDKKTLAADASYENVKVTFVGFQPINGNITFVSGDKSLSIPLSVVYSTSFVQPEQNEFYYIQQRTGGKVLGNSQKGDRLVLRYADKSDLSQQIVFKPSSNNQNRYFIATEANYYLTVAENKAVFQSEIENATEWVLQGESDSLVYITQATNSALVLGSDSILHNSSLFSDRNMTHVNSAFALQKISAINTNYMFDPSFENHPTDAGPMGTWIPSDEKIQLGTYGYSRVQNSAWASSGKKCMYLRFLGDGTSYTTISQKLHGLTPGAAYRFDLKYKCQSTSGSSLVNIYASSVPNAARTAALGGVYSTTTVAASNLASQSAQSTSISFVAPSTEAYIVYSKNTNATNYNFFIDNLELTETKPSALSKQIHDIKVLAFFENNVLNIKCDEFINEKTLVEISDIHGRLIYSESFEPSNPQIQIRNTFPNGVYPIKLSVAGNQFTIKAINY